jgi:hypothetical protein
LYERNAAKVFPACSAMRKARVLMEGMRNNIEVCRSC